jgi:hypothetical protein
MMQKNNNLVDIPAGSFIYANGYVYVNISSEYDPAVKYTKSTRRCIGKSLDGKRMYANGIYTTLFDKDSLPDAPEKSDSVSVGMHLLIAQIAQSCGLNGALADAFSDDDVKLIKDMASFMLITESDVFQHYPTFGYFNAIFSKEIRSDSTICRFLHGAIRPTQIQKFLDKWADNNRGSGKAYLCYDSTNINCVAEGVDLAQMGHAKDDARKPQINIEYVVRQEDGLPLIYKDYPGSIVDITQASDMIATINSLGYQDVTAICDRGYISTENIEAFDNAGIHFLMMIRGGLNVHKELIEKYGKKIRLRSEQFIPEHDLYGITVKHRLFGKGASRFFHIFGDQLSGDKGRKSIMREVALIAKDLDIRVAKGKIVSENEEKNFSKRFYLEIDPVTRVLISYKQNNSKIDKEVSCEGFFILVSSEGMTCLDAINAYSKRDCVEKCFRALKTNIGMNAIRAHSNECAEGRLFIAFVASIMRAVIFHGLNDLRTKDRKNFTVPSVIRELEKIEVLRDYKTQKYSRRYKLTARQKKIYAAFALHESMVDEFSGRL